MKELLILLSPVFWSIKNDLTRFNRSFYKKAVFYTLSSAVFIFSVTRLLNAGMAKLQNLSPEVFNIMLIKGYSLIFIIIFFIQIINAVIISLNTFYQSRELEVLFTSPVNRMSLFFSRLFETHLKASWMLIIFGIPLLVSIGLLLHATIAYYFYSLALFMAFSIIPVNIGIGTAIMLSGVFHIKKLKKFMLSAGIVTVAAVITLFRLFKPEKFVNPELFANLTLFLAELKTPSFILLPNRWLSESIFSFLNKNYGEAIIFISLLLLTPYITAVLLISIYKKYHYRGWSLLQGGDIILKRKRGHISNFINGAISLKPLQNLLLLSDSQSKALFLKDLLYQFHDIKNIQQYLILFSLIIIYLFSIASLPMNWEGYAVRLKYIISFFNLGLILAIMGALCSKLVYPLVASEGNFLWAIKTSPITPGKYIRTKFFFSLIPVFLLGQLLTIFSSLFINIEKPVFILNILTTALLCMSLVSMALAFSVSDLKNKAKPMTEETGTGSALYMITSFFFILFTLALEMIPLYLYFLKASAKVEFTQKAWLIIGTVFSVLMIVNLLVTAISMRVSIKRFNNLQIG
jgi:hypothetical protein